MERLKFYMLMVSSYRLFNKTVFTPRLLSANNLYGLAQSFPMPLGDYRWLTLTEILALDWFNMTDDQETGYIVECDLQYPESLHESHNSFPLAPEHLEITEDMLSPYAKGENKSRAHPSVCLS